MTCFIAAFITMLSRVSDYYHRPTDVIGGTILGNKNYNTWNLLKNPKFFN